MEMVDAYLRALEGRGRRANTISTYRYELLSLGEWISVRQLRDLSELRLVEIEAWQRQLSRHAAPSSRQVATVALRGALKWAHRQGHQLAEPALWSLIESVRVPPGQPKPIPREDLDLVLAAFEPAQTDIWWLRTRALFWLLYTTGARISEALSLDRDSIDPDGTAPVIQKGGRQHLLVLSKEAVRAISDYLQARTDDSPALFLSLPPGKRGERMDRSEAQKGWDRLCRELAIPRFTNHQTRHTCGTTMRRKTGDLLLCAKHLGHQSLRMMLRYAEVDVDDRQRAVALLDPAV